MNLLQIETFLEVARAGSFAVASRRMSLPTSTISARIKAMEDRIGVTLFRRTTRKVALTTDGQHFFEVYTEAFEVLSSLESRSHRAGDLSGHIRLTAPIDFPMPALAGALASFSKQYPSITFEVLVTDDVLDFVDQNIDIALRGRAPGGNNLICRKLGSDPLGLFVSRTYYETHHAQLDASDFEGHTILDPLNQKQALGSAGKGMTAPFIQTENKELCKAMALQSHGIALLGQSVCKADVQSGALVALKHDLALPDLTMFLVMPSKRLVPKRVRLLVDHLVETQITKSPQM